MIAIEKQLPPPQAKLKKRCKKQRIILTVGTTKYTLTEREAVHLSNQLADCVDSLEPKENTHVQPN